MAQRRRGARTLSGPSDLVNALLQVASADSLDGLARVLDDIAPAVGADTVELSYLDDGAQLRRGGGRLGGGTSRASATTSTD